MTPFRQDDLNTATRTCPFCAEVIKAQAKVCPRCRQWLTLRSIRNPVLAAWIYGVPHLAFLALMAVVILTALDRIENPKPDYTSYLGSVRVLETRMNWVLSTNGPRIYVTGILTNQSPIAWRDIEFDCRFFDGSGALMDAAHPHFYFTIQPHDDAAFRVTVTPSRATNDYNSLRLSVTTVRNTKSIF